MAIDKLVALVTILALIPTSIISPDSTGNDQTQSTFLTDISECIDQLRSTLQNLQWNIYYREYDCVHCSKLTIDQCLLENLNSDYSKKLALRWSHEIPILLQSLDLYRSDQTPSAEREAFEKFWLKKARAFCGYMKKLY
ncbi:MAG: hypothetical protein MHMPM18_003369 [Marteilia pararefringens]